MLPFPPVEGATSVALHENETSVDERRYPDSGMT